MGDFHSSDSGPCLTLEKLAMKKSLIALATLAAVSGTAFAQSTVTLYGVVDAGVMVNGAASTTKFASGINGTPRLGFRGTEDLGGGLKASFTVESSFNNGKETATSIGDRGAHISLSGGFGTVQMGSSVLSPSFFARAATDPSTTNNYSIIKYGTSLVRMDNGIHYASPKIAGMTIRAAIVQKDDNGGAKSATDVSISYSNGPLTLGASSADNGVDSGSYFGAAYNFGMAKVFVNSVDVAQATAAASGTEKYTSYGVSAPFGALTLQADMRTRKDAEADTYVVSAQYALSKRSKLTAYTSKTEKVKANMGFGIRHNF